MRRTVYLVMGAILLTFFIVATNDGSVTALEARSIKLAAEWAAFDTLCETKLPTDFRKRVHEWRSFKPDAMGHEYRKLVASLKEDEARLRAFCDIEAARVFQMVLDDALPTTVGDDRTSRPTQRGAMVPADIAPRS